MDSEAVARREKMQTLRETLRNIERNRLAGASCCSLEELDQAMSAAIRAASARTVSKEK